MDTLFPQPGGAEEWQAWHDDQDNWKKRALFMALNCNEKVGFYELIKRVMNAPSSPALRAGEEGVSEAPPPPPPLRGGALNEAPTISLPLRGGISKTPISQSEIGDCNTGGENGSDKIDDMCTRLQKLKLSKQMPPTSPQELASIINEVDMSNVDCAAKSDTTPKNQKEEKVDEIDSAVLLPIVQRKLTFVNSEATAVAATCLNVAEYRKRACLPATMPALRIAKQFIFAAMQLQGNEHPQFEKLKTADQTHFAPFDKEKDAVALEQCIDALDKQKLTQLLSVHADEPAFLAVAGKANEMDSAELVKAVIRQNKPCNTLINVILGL